MKPRSQSCVGASRLSEALRRDPRLAVEAIDGTVLARIVTKRFERIEALPAATPEAVERVKAFRRAVLEVRFGSVAFRPFESALKSPGRHFILEVKCASPSMGVMRESFDIERVLPVFERFADALSVLTEPDFFGGSSERLSEIRAKTKRPILAKDFFVDRRQILEAARRGADAVLLMHSILSPERSTISPALPNPLDSNRSKRW